jgi:hypothetical protein
MVKKTKKASDSDARVVHLHVGDGNSERETDESEVEALDIIEEGQLSRAIEEVRQVEGARAEVYRVLPAERQGHCRVYPVSVFSHERVAADYGPGKYRVRFKGPGDKYIRGGGTFDIAEGLNPPAAPQGGIQDVLALFKAERERDEAEREKRKGEWLEWAKILAPLALPKILEMIGGGSKGPSIRDLVATMKDMKDLQAPSADLQTQFTQVISILQGAKELVGDDGGKATGSTWVDLIRDAFQSPAAGALVSALSGQAQRLPLPSSSPTAARPLPLTASVAPVAPASSSASAPNTGGESLSPNVIQQLQWLRGTITQLLVQAAKNSRPRIYAEVVLDNLPDFITPQDLIDRLLNENWLQQLQQIDARVAQHAEWFGRFREYVLRALERREQKAQESSGVGNGVGVETATTGINQPRPDIEEGAFE